MPIKNAQELPSGNQGAFHIPWFEYPVNISGDDISPKENFSLGDALASVYPLLDIIFDYLSWADLEAVSRTCTTWSDVAERILASRKSFLKPLFTAFTKNKLVRSNNFSHYKFQYSCFFFDNHRRKTPKHFPYTTRNGEIHKGKGFSAYVKDNHKSEASSIIKGANIYFAPYLDNALMFASISIPKLNGVRIVPFEKKDLPEIENDEKISALLLFSQKIGTKLLKSFIEDYGSRFTENLAFCGGLLHTCKFGTHTGFVVLKKDAPDIEFTSYSAMILEHEDTDAALCKFKEELPLNKNTIVFMAQCCGRDKGQLTPKRFNNIFPDIPLLGISVNGEYGLNSRNADIRKLKDLNSVLMHGYSISLLFLTWGKRNPPV